MPHKSKKAKIGWVLSGGVGLGHFLVGAMEALVENGIFPDYIVAVSSGALVASKFAETQSASSVIRLSKTAFKKPPYKFNPSVVGHALMLNLTKPVSFYNNDELKSVVETYIDAREVAKSLIELEVLSVNMTDGMPYFFSNKRNTPETFRKAILATTSLPGFFPPVEIDGSLWIDGAMHSPFPLTRAIEVGCTKIYGIHCMPELDELSKEQCERLGWLRSLARGQWFDSESLTQHEIFRLKEHNRIAGYASFISRMAKKILPSGLKREAQKILETDFANGIPELIGLTLIRAPKKLLVEPAKWTPDDVQIMRESGYRTTLAVIKA